MTARRFPRFTFVLLLALFACHREPYNGGHSIVRADDEARILFERPNQAAGVTAQFFGRATDPASRPSLLIDHITLKNTRSGETVTYAPDVTTRQAADFFFADVWSPDGQYLVLPLDKYDGFAIYRAQTAIADVKRGTPADTVRVWTGEARKYWHVFDGWTAPASLRFRGELERSSFAFEYRIGDGILSCRVAPCGLRDHARNKAGVIAVALP